MLKDRMFYTTSEDVIGGIISRDNNGTKYWYHTDRLGNVMAVTDSNGAAYAVYTMDAWGNVLEKGLGNGYSSEHGTDPQPYHLTTKEYDPDSQLYYFNARWYEPTIGRFVSRGEVPVEREHPYAFCECNPANETDSTGLLRDCDQEHICCFEKCWSKKPPWPFRKGKSSHYRYCQAKCLAEYMECLADNAAERACDWVADHPFVVGTIVVIGGVTYVVVTGGGGAIVLLAV